MLGYAIVGIALCIFVQARNVYPQLLLARMFFSIGGAATSTMVTAVLPSMITSRREADSRIGITEPPNNGHAVSPSISSELTITQQRHQHSISSTSVSPEDTQHNASPMRLAGFVGLFTGCGALVALLLFFPLPAFFRSHGADSGPAVAYSFYLVGVVAMMVSIFCLFGLRGINDERITKWETGAKSGISRESLLSSLRLLLDAILLGFTSSSLALAYLGGFVARASSVGISLFIPLYVNAYFLSSGLCRESADTPEAVKEQCRRAYILAAELTGISQLVALLFAPVFGYLAEKFPKFNSPLLVAALAGILGYSGLATLKSPETHGDGSPIVFAIMCVLGISQIGAIVCSLGLLGRCILEGQGAHPPSPADASAENATETSGLLEGAPALKQRYAYPKGSIAGVYSLAGGAGILLLTKLGGYWFDTISPSAPFVMLSAFNGILLLFGLGCGLSEALSSGR